MGVVFDMWQKKFAKFFIPYKYLTVDEALLPFWGCCSFKQYMPTKPEKYGLDFWCLCDASTGHRLKMKPYFDTNNDAKKAKNLKKQVAMELTKHFRCW